MQTTLLLLAPLAIAFAGDGEDTPAKPQFAAPVQLTRGGENHTGILYPSPVLADVDGDGQAELVIGDLPGSIVYSERLQKGEDHEWSTPQPLKADGKPLELDNW